MRSVLAAYEADVEAFGGLAERTKVDYIGKLRLIERSFGDFPSGRFQPSKPGGPSNPGATSGPEPPRNRNAVG